jgi:poly(hydroxyalkanoate) depolymerase family esterase
MLQHSKVHTVYKEHGDTEQIIYGVKMLNPMLDAWSSLALSPWMMDPFRIGAWPEPAQDADTGKFISDRFDGKTGSLRYKLFIPNGYTGAPLPLIVMLHGCGQDADDFASGTGMNELAEKFQCLVAYPEQSAGANGGKCWNWFEEAHHQRDQGEPALIAGVTRKILAEYAVDEARVFVAGLSSGGAMAVILGRTYPDLFTAVGCHSGLAHGSATDRLGAMRAMRDGADPGRLARNGIASSGPIIVFHGDIDSTVHLKNSDGVVQQSIDSYAAGVPRRRQKLAMALSEERGEMTGRGFTRNIHRGVAGEIVAEQWTVHGAGHAWSGGSGRGSYTDAQGPDASEAMLRFFIRR